MRIPQNIRKYAKEDIESVIQRVSQDLGLSLELDELAIQSYIPQEDLVENGGSYDFVVNIVATANITVNSDKRVTYTWTYTVVDEDYETILFSGLNEMAAQLKKELAKYSTVVSTTRHKGRRRIVAADEFGNDDMAAFDDQLDTISDTVDDIKDAVDEIAEDDPTISIDNNIADHYIAECDKCKGVFISAVVESDQEIESVSGICPLCGKESDQWLKWIIRSANEGVFEDLELDEEALE